MGKNKKKTEKRHTQKVRASNQSRRLPAKAPYNFIQLNEYMIPALPIPTFNKYHKDRYCGYINLEIKSLTPLYIKRVKDIPDFFSINGKARIPGSSIRGMIRTLVEIISFGKFKFFDDKRLFHRGMADRSTLKNEYRNKIRNREEGFLYYDEKKSSYFIRPAKGSEKIPDDMTKEFQIESYQNNSYKIWSGKIPKKKNIWIILEPDPAKRPIELSDKDILDYKNDDNRNIPDHGDSNYYDLLKIAKEKKFSDKNNQILNLPYGIPVFFLRYKTKDEPNNVRIAFGHTGFFRLPYEYTIGDHIPVYLKDDDKTDFSEALFGVEDKWASRIYFEDALITNGQKDIYLDETSPQILSSPKPTTFQHYLEQSKGIFTERNNLKHWGSREAHIRGYKLYWHRNTPDNPKGSNGKYSWNEGKIKNDKQHTVIKPIRKGVKFRSRIVFENLTKEELGALLFILDLPKNCFHKLGMGKPLGLGTVQITPYLYLIDRERRYKSLFDGETWNTALYKNDDIEPFKRIFEQYILKKISKIEKSSTQSLWEIPRLKQLRTMLKWYNNDKFWLEKTRYMFIECTPNLFNCICKPKNDKDKCNEFKNRHVLPKPDEM